MHNQERGSQPRELTNRETSYYMLEMREALERGEKMKFIAMPLNEDGSVNFEAKAFAGDEYDMESFIGNSKFAVFKKQIPIAFSRDNVQLISKGEK